MKKRCARWKASSSGPLLDDFIMRAFSPRAPADAEPGACEKNGCNPIKHTRTMERNMAHGSIAMPWWLQAPCKSLEDRRVWHRTRRRRDLLPREGHAAPGEVLSLCNVRESMSKLIGASPRREVFPIACLSVHPKETRKQRKKETWQYHSFRCFASRGAPPLGGFALACMCACAHAKILRPHACLRCIQNLQRPSSAAMHHVCQSLAEASFFADGHTVSKAPDLF